MTTRDNYSNEHTIRVRNGVSNTPGTLIIDANLEVTGNVEYLDITDTLDVGGLSTLAGSAIITTPDGDVDFSTTKEYRYHVPMVYIQQLMSGGYGTAVFTTPFASMPDTTTEAASTNYIGRPTFPLLRFTVNSQNITIPVHEIVRDGTLKYLVISCETLNAEVFASSPVYATWQKMTKAGTAAMTSSSPGTVITTYTFLNNTRNMLIVPITDITFDGETEMLFVTMTRSFTSANEMIVFSVELVVDRTIYSLIG